MEALDTAQMPVMAFTYEKLVAEPNKTVDDLIAYFNIPEKHAEDMVATMDRDSQEGTRIARTVLKKSG